MPRVAFSAALSLPRSEPGTVPFDRVLLNDGGYYDPETGKPGSGQLGTAGNGGGCAVICPHSCRFRQAESFHSLVWGDPYSLLHLFILTTAWTEG